MRFPVRSHASSEADTVNGGAAQEPAKKAAQAKPIARMFMAGLSLGIGRYPRIAATARHTHPASSARPPSGVTAPSHRAPVNTST